MKAVKLFLIAILVVLACNYSNGQTTTVMDDLKKAQSLAASGNTSEASGVYLDIMGKYPDNREAVQGWLMISMKRSPTGEEEAIKQLEGLEKTYPQNTAILFFKTFLLAEYAHNDEALKNADRLIELKPDDGLIWLLRGQILEAMNRSDEALAAYDKATILDSKNADAWQNKAGILAKNKRFDESITAYTKAIEIAPSQPVFIYNRGCVYCLKGDKGSALSDLGKAVTMNPQFKTYAATDEDYKSLWEDADFKKIISQ
jgi:tetratricopeptide (TPR) repeat protein